MIDERVNDYDPKTADEWDETLAEESSGCDPAPLERKRVFFPPFL